MDEYNSLHSIDTRRQHELLTLGGMISPGKVVAERILDYVTETQTSEKIQQDLEQIIAELEALLERVIEKGVAEDLNEIDKYDLRDFYHQSFVQWKTSLYTLVQLLDEIMELDTLTSTHIQEIDEWNKKLRRFFHAEEWQG